MANPAETSPRITVQKLVVDRTEGPLTAEIARQGLESFNASCQHKPMTLGELLDVMRIANELGATDTTATFQLDEKAPHRTWTICAIKAGNDSQPKGTPQTPPFHLTARQQACAERMLIEVIGDLAKCGHKGTDLNERAISLASSLQAGLHQLATAFCSTQSASYE